MKDGHENEKMALELLSEHKNIIKYFKYFEDEDSYNFILEHCPNDSLEAFMKRFETTPIDLVTFYTAQIVHVLEFMHNKHIILHRDLKP